MHGVQGRMLAKKAFVRYVSHEIRTPLNTVFLGLQLLHDEMTGSAAHPTAQNSSSTWIEALDEVRDSCNIALRTLNDLLSMDKLEDGLLKLEKTEEQAWEFIQNTVRPFLIQVPDNYNRTAARNAFIFII